MPPPTQGLASLLLLGVYDRLEFVWLRILTLSMALLRRPNAFRIRDRYVTDPAYMDIDPVNFLNGTRLDAMAADIHAEQALPWPDPVQKG